MRQVRNRVQRLAKDQRGFTMLELLMVMFIVGTLAGLGVSTYSGMAQRRDVARADVLWRSLSSAVAMYQMTHEGFPASIAELGEFLDLSESQWADNLHQVTPAQGPEPRGIGWALMDAADESRRCIGIWVNGQASSHNGPDCPEDW
jgi:prepilin-type N-terminal cleavage/methylation domain